MRGNLRPRDRRRIAGAIGAKVCRKKKKHLTLAPGHDSVQARRSPGACSRTGPPFLLVHQASLSIARGPGTDRIWSGCGDAFSFENATKNIENTLAERP